MRAKVPLSPDTEVSWGSAGAKRGDERNRSIGRENTWFTSAIAEGAEQFRHRTQGARNGPFDYSVRNPEAFFSGGISVEGGAATQSDVQTHEQNMCDRSEETMTNASQ